MATVVDSIDIRGLRVAHFMQLRSYIDERDETGWYSGRKDQFEERHKDLISWIDRAISTVREEGVIIPK